MICRISRAQQEETAKVLRRLIRNNQFTTPEEILKGTYNIAYSEFAKQGKTKDAETQSLYITQYAADKLELLLNTDNEKIRQIMGKMAGQSHQFEQGYLQKYTNIDELRILLSLKDNNLQPVESTVKPEEVSTHLDKIWKRFPPISKKVKFKNVNSLLTDTVEFPVVTNEAGQEIKLPQVTEFVNKKLRYITSNTIQLRLGSLTDMVVRKFFAKPTTYDAFRKAMLNDKEYKDAFRYFSEGTPASDEAFSPETVTYMDDFLKDMIYPIHYIQENFKDAHLTDLTSLVKNDPTLTEDQKSRYFLYSAEVGLRGELDLVAIKPDGSYTVIDIKTTDGYHTSTDIDKHNKQASIYDLLLSPVAGIKSSGKNVIFYLTTSYTNPSRLMGNKEGGRYRASITAWNTQENTNVPTDQLLKEIGDWKEQSIDRVYSKVATTPAVKSKNKFNPLSGYTSYDDVQKQLKKDDDNKKPLSQVFVHDERLSTHESLLEGQQWLRDRFSEIADKIQILRTINSDKGGEMLLDAIKLYTRSNEGVAYHEGWHRFSQLYMTVREKLDLYKKLRKDSIPFTTRDGKKLNTADAEFLDLEEMMAEEFKNFAQNPDTYSFPQPEVKNWFQKVWDAIKAIFNYLSGKGEKGYMDLFRELNSNSFNRSNYSTDNAIFSHLNSFMPDTISGKAEALDNQTFLQFRDFMDFTITKFLTEKDRTITDYMTREGIDELTAVIQNNLIFRRDQIEAVRAQIQEQIEGEESEAAKDDMRAYDSSLKFNLDALNVILEQDAEDNLIRFNDFRRAYFKKSGYQSLRKFIKDNIELLNVQNDTSDIEEEIIDNLPDEEDQIKKGKEDELGGEDKFNASGNEKEAIRNAKTELLDFFTAVQRRSSSEVVSQSSGDIYQYKNGLPVTLSKQEAFYKTLRILSGSLTLQEMERRLYSQQNHMIFPELIQIKERLLGNDRPIGAKGRIEGLIPKFQRLSTTLLSNSASQDDINEHSKLFSFLLHFQYVLSLRKADIDNFIVRTNYTKDDLQSGFVYPMQSRPNWESSIFAIVNDFVQGFQTSMTNLYKGSGKEYVNVYEAMYNILGTNDERGLSDFLNGLFKQQFILEPVSGRFVFNVNYVLSKYEDKRIDVQRTSAGPKVTEGNKKTMKSFFDELGMNLNQNLYDNDYHVSELVRHYNKLRSVLTSFRRKMGEDLASLAANTRVKALLNEWKAAKDRSEQAGISDAERIVSLSAVTEKEAQLRGYVNRVFTTSPVEQLIFDGSDDELMSKNPANRLFAANEHIFRAIATMEREYHKRFSSGSVQVIDKTIYSYFRPNTMLVTEMYVNDHVNDISDFGKIPALSHLDPVKNPQNLNSFIFQQMFDKSGNKRSNVEFSVDPIGNGTYIYAGGRIESKTVAEMNTEEKMVFDFLMSKSDGWTEVRRMEASNTAWRLSLQSKEADAKKFIRAIKDLEAFSNGHFLGLTRGYIQYAAWKYQYDQVPANRILDENYKKKDTLGIFDEMLPKTASRIKDFINTEGKDMNSLMYDIETKNNDLFKEINQEIATYFEGIAVKNENSYMNVFNDLLSNDSRAILSSISAHTIDIDSLGGITAKAAREFIANDFVQVMEDNILFFGDYTYYDDPIKRRKYSGNNGSLHIVDDIIEEGIKAQMQTNSIGAVYRKYNNIVDNKDYRLVKKVIMKDVKMTSNLLQDDKMLKDIQLMRKQSYGIDVSIEDLRAEKAETLKAFTDMEVADAAAFINPDLNRIMRMREMTWDMDRDEKEYKKQQLLEKSKYTDLTPEEQDFSKKAFSGFNVAKYALTGPVYSADNMPLKPAFDKMGMRVLTPEMDGNRTTRPIMERMFKDGIDYMVFATGSKVFQPHLEDAFTDDGIKSALNPNELATLQHAGSYFKYQQNTSKLNDKSTFAVQLRSIFYELMLTQKKYGSISPNLKNAYSKVIRSLTDYIRINSSQALTQMGLNLDGKIVDKRTFANYIRERLSEIDEVDENLVSLLKVDENGDFAQFLETLPFQKNIMDLMTGIINDNFSKIKLTGTKFYQAPELGTNIYQKELTIDKSENKGTIELKWHGLETVDGKITSTLPVECKIGFRKQFFPLLNLKHPDGEKMSTLKRLNEAISNPEWAKSNYDSITFIGVRIPLQDINFVSHIIVKEFLPESQGDTIILPPEFYKQTGADNDIDTVTSTFKTLDSYTGKVLRRPNEEYSDIVNRINELSSQLKGKEIGIKDESVQTLLDELKTQFIDNEIYVKEGLGVDAMERDFGIRDDNGLLYLAGQEDKNSPINKILAGKKFPEMEQYLSNFFERINKLRPNTIRSEVHKELAALMNKRKKYKDGIINDVVTAMMKFMEAPENFDYLTETDSIKKIKDIAAKVISNRTGKAVTANDLGKPQSSLQSMTYLMNMSNHSNNFEKRTMLGGFIKIRNVLPLLDIIGIPLHNDYISGSIDRLLNEPDTPAAEIVDKMAKGLTKLYRRDIFTPLLYKKDRSRGIDISIYNEDGGRITKDLSMLVSSGLDLFKNRDVFPSLNMSWLEFKPFVFLMAQGVPLERAIMFLNTPIVQEIQKESLKLGKGAYARHALVSFAQQHLLDARENAEIYLQPQRKNLKENEGDIEFKSENVFFLKVIGSDGVEKINKKMRRIGKPSQDYLKGKNISFSEEDMTDFTKTYYAFMSDKKVKDYNKKMSRFLELNPKFAKIARELTAYYGTLMEDGDSFYRSFVKGLNRNGGALNTEDAIYDAMDAEKVRRASHMMDSGFDKAIKEESSQTPFYNDATILNILSNRMPQLLDNEDKYFSSKFHDMMRSITSQIRNDREAKMQATRRILSDFTEMLYKKFYVYKVTANEGNALYEHFMNDITPIIGLLKRDKEGWKKFISEFTLTKAQGITEDQKIQTLFADNAFPNQIELFLAKYPELKDVSLLFKLIGKKEQGRNPYKTETDTNWEGKDILNMLSQNYLMLNMSGNPNEKRDEEEVIRKEWNDLYNFDISLFPQVESVVSNDDDRLDFYRDVDNIEEIRTFARKLAMYALNQSSPLEKTRAAFSYLAPPSIINEVISQAIINFNRYLKTAGLVFDTDRVQTGNEKERRAAVDDLLFKFQTMFKDMNVDLKWQDTEFGKPPIQLTFPGQDGGEEDDDYGTEEAIYNPSGKAKKKESAGLPYMKYHTGKLYNQITSPLIDRFQSKLFKDAGLTKLTTNDFTVSFPKDKQDPLNC